MPVSHAEDLLRTTYELYDHGPSSTPYIACISYSVPFSIAYHVSFITPTTNLDIHVPKSWDAKRSGCTADTVLTSGSIVTPELGADLASLATHAAAGTTNWDSAITPCLGVLQPNGLGVVKYTPRSYLTRDLSMFFKTYAPTLASKRPVNTSIDVACL
ncbi:hypothetical protein DL93DRAFT_2154350 [Clavulina sp. PMI_390]|nr:hypothetical protein DL93DRAFT_2154350 [Clavulina sp. PMI_390]